MSQQFDILHADDSLADALVFKEALKETLPNASVYWVPSGEDALAFLRKEGRFAGLGPAKLVVLDLNMPGLGGLETARVIRSSPGIHLLPIVMLSSSKARWDIESAYSAGVNVYFPKSTSLEQFTEHVRILVQHWLSFAMLPAAAR